MAADVINRGAGSVSIGLGRDSIEQNLARMLTQVWLEISKKNLKLIYKLKLELKFFLLNRAPGGRGPELRRLRHGVGQVSEGRARPRDPRRFHGEGDTDIN